MNLSFRSPAKRLLCILTISTLLAGGCLQTHNAAHTDSPSDSSDAAGDSAKNSHGGTSVDKHAQSPIDIPEQAMAPEEPHRIALHYHETAEHIIHREHTIELDVDPDDGSGIDFDGQTYVLDQFHFHTPSKHLAEAIGIQSNSTWSIVVRKARSSWWASSSRWARHLPSSSKS